MDKTTSVGQTFASFSLQIKWLLIGSELQENEIQVKRTAEVIRVLSNHIVKTVERVIVWLEKEDVRVQVAKGCDRVHAAADGLVVASQMVGIVGSGFRRSGSLVDQATLLYRTTVELLRLASDVEATSVSRCSQSVYAAMDSLLSAKDLNHLEELVMNYSEVVSCFENDISKRNVLLCEAVNFQSVNSSIDALKKSIPLLSASLKTLLMYQEIEEAQVSKNNVVGLVLSSLDSLSEALHERNQDWPLSDSSLQVKQFSTVCKEVVGSLNMIAATNSMSSQDLALLEVHLNHIVQYAMDLADVAGKESKTNIFKTCSMLIENQDKISQESQSSSHSAWHDGKCSVSVSTELCQLQIDCLRQLQAKVADILPNVIVGIIIKDQTKSVFDLLNAIKERCLSEDFLLEAKEPVDSIGIRVQFCADQFRAQCKDVCSGVRLAVAGSTSRPTDVQEMHGCICTAEKLGNKILLEAKELSHDNLDRSKAHIEILEADCNEWCSGVEKLLEDADKFVAAETLMMICGEMIWRAVSSHSHSSVSNKRTLDESVVLMTNRFINLSTKANDKHLDAWLRNGLRRKIAALERDVSMKGERSCGTGFDSTCFYRLLQQSVADICWCVKTGRLTNDTHEASLSVVRVAFERLIDNALTESNSTGLSESEVNFDLLTSLGLHGSAFCEIKEIFDCLIFASVSCAAEEDTSSRLLLFTSNHILHSVLLVMGSVERKDWKRTFIMDKLSQLTDFVPMILDEANAVRSFKKSDLEPLYELGEKLCHTMSLLIDFVDEILRRWNPLPQNLVTSAMDGEWPLLREETEELNQQVTSVMDLISSTKEDALEDFEDEDFGTLTETDSLKEFLEEIESLSYRVMSSTRKLNSNGFPGGKNSLVPELRILLRDWSTRVFFFNARLDRLSVRYVSGDYTWSKRILWMRQENDRLKNEIRNNSDGETATVQMLEDLHRICDQMDDLAKLSDHLFLSQKLTVLSSQWSSKVRRLENLKEDGISSTGSSRHQSSTDQSSASIGNGNKQSRYDDGPAATEAVPRITGDENTLRQIKQRDWFEKYNSDRSATDISLTSGKILRDVQSPINGSSKMVKTQVPAGQMTRRFLGYKNDGGAYATSGSIVDCIDEMSRAAYQLKDHLQAQRESFGNVTSSKDRVTELLVTIQNKEERVTQVADILVNYCLDERIGDDVKSALQHVHSILSQLNILVGVKMAIDDKHTEDKNLKTSIQRLLDSLNDLKRGFEAACIKGLKQSLSESIADREIRAMARWWKTNWIQSQSLNSLLADKDELGLRTSKNYLSLQQPL